MKRDAGTWFRLMLIAFTCNGIGPFGLKVLGERKLGEHQAEYLLYWYLGGLTFALIAFAGKGLRVAPKEVALGAVMGVCSLCGQAFTGLALSHGLPGHVVYPLTTGGSLFLVTATGIIAFKERVGPFGIAGIALGITALVMLGST